MTRNPNALDVQEGSPGRDGGGGGTCKSIDDRGSQAGTLSTADGARRLDDHESVDGIGGAAGIDGGWLRKRQGASGDTGRRDDGRSIRDGIGDDTNFGGGISTNTGNDGRR